MHYRHIPALLILLLLRAPAAAQIEVYFNMPVDTALAHPPGNIATGSADLSLIAVAELERAQFSVDMAMYSLNLERVADALIAAKERGVKVRVIGDRGNLDDAGARFRLLAQRGIPVAANPPAPAGEQQPLMHHKFLAIDARPGAPDGARPRVITGSWNATAAQTYDDPNNLLVIRDGAIASAYVGEFEEMWGGPGDLPDTAHARFGAAKRRKALHHFTLGDGTGIELRFSPGDSTSSRINALLAGAGRSIYTANLTFTYAPFAATLNERREAGADIRVLVDNVDDKGSQFAFLRTFADAHDWKGEGLLHHKYAVIDANPPGVPSPLVITGSHNWTVSAETRNDENTLIISSGLIANLYLQEFAPRYREAGGERTFVSLSRVERINGASPMLHAYPNPFADEVTLAARLGAGTRGSITITDAMGREVMLGELSDAAPLCRWESDGLPAGIYVVTLRAGGIVEHARLLLRR